MSQEDYQKLRATLLGLQEAAQFTSASQSYLRRHSVGRIEPVIPFRKIAGRIKFTVGDLENFIQSQPRSPDLPSDEELALEIRNARAGNISPEDQAVLDSIPRKG